MEGSTYRFPNRIFRFEPIPHHPPGPQGLSQYRKPDKGQKMCNLPPPPTKNRSLSTIMGANSLKTKAD